MLNLLLFVVHVGALYDKGNVVELTKENFKTLVLGSNDFWFVEFYAPWCGHCKNLVPEWTKLADALKGVAKVGALDMTQHQEVGQNYGVNGFPTIKFFVPNSAEPVDYDGARSAKDFASFAFKHMKQAVATRLGVKKSEPKAKAVVELTDKSFKDVLASDDLWMVAFVAPWCGHCKALHPQWEKAATALVGKAKLGSVDATKYTELAGQYSIQGYPTIKVFQKGKPVSDYNGQRTVESIVAFVDQQSGAGSAESEETDVITLTDASFEESVIANEDIWLVEFFAPWCGHCKNLAPNWKAAAKQLKDKVKLGAVDCTQETQLCSKYGVQGYPTVKEFLPGSKDQPNPYEGRSTSTIVQHGFDLYNSFRTPPKISELSDPAAFRETCQTSLCLIAFLPHILDSQATGRREYIAILETMAKKFRQQPIAYYWSESLAQEDLEQAVGAGGSGYPALAIVNAKKQRHIPFAGHFSDEGVSTFLQRIFAGKEPTLPFTMPNIKAVVPWDGKDASIPKEEL